MNSIVERVGWVAEPTGRGTIGLLWSCFATIFLCTWSAVHPNLPALDDPQWEIIGRKVSYMIVAILAPELVAIMAMDELQFVKHLRQISLFKHPHSGCPWTLKHYYFLYMGGLVVKMDSTSPKRFKARELARLIQNEEIEAPTIEEQDIDDRSKANWFTKAIALLQIVSFLAQMLARAIARLPVTTLELFTLSIVVCGLVTYIFNWQKPFDVQRPVVLQTRAEKDEWPKEVKRIGFINNDLYPLTEKFVFIALCSVFAAAHLIGWNFAFASSVEKWLWRSGSLGCIILPALLYGSSYITDRGSTVEDMFFLVITVVYIVARICLLAEVLVGLRSLPAGVYETYAHKRM